MIQRAIFLALTTGLLVGCATTEQARHQDAAPTPSAESRNAQPPASEEQAPSQDLAQAPPEESQKAQPPASEEQARSQDAAQEPSEEIREAQDKSSEAHALCTAQRVYAGKLDSETRTACAIARETDKHLRELLGQTGDLESNSSAGYGAARWGMKLHEVQRVVTAAVEETNGRVPVIAGCGYGTARQRHW